MRVSITVEVESLEELKRLLQALASIHETPPAPAEAHTTEEAEAESGQTRAEEPEAGEAEEGMVQDENGLLSAFGFAPAKPQETGREREAGGDLASVVGVRISNFPWWNDNTVIAPYGYIMRSRRYPTLIFLCDDGSYGVLSGRKFARTGWRERSAYIVRAFRPDEVEWEPVSLPTPTTGEAVRTAMPPGVYRVTYSNGEEGFIVLDNVDTGKGTQKIGVSIPPKSNWRGAGVVKILKLNPKSLKGGDA